MKGIATLLICLLCLTLVSLSFKYLSYNLLPSFFVWLNSFSLFIELIISSIIISLILAISRGLLEITGMLGKIIYGKQNDIISLVTLLACILATIFCCYFLWTSDIKFNVFSIIILIFLSVMTGAFNGLFTLNDRKLPLDID